MCILLPNGMRVFPMTDEDGHILYAEQIRALGEVPVDDLKMIPAGHGVAFRDTEPGKRLSPEAEAARESLRDILFARLRHRAERQG